MLSFHGSTLSKTRWTKRHLFRRLRCQLYFSTSPVSSSKVRTESACIDGDCADFLPWLELKAGTEISSVLSIGESAYGRSLFACRPIKAGDCILKVPYSVQLSSNNLPLGINSLLGDQVSNVAKVALFVLYEQQLGEQSEWAPYISRLPQPAEMHSTVIADRNYAPGDQVLIRYGKFSNATLLLDFGFTLLYNAYDQVLNNVESSNPWRMSILWRFGWEVRSAQGKGRGIPQSFRAYARVMCSNSPQEINDLAIEAAENDGRLARRPLRDKCREIEAHQFLLLRITELIKLYNASIKSLELQTSLHVVNKPACRYMMAHDLLSGELHILKSAAEWLENYCVKLLQV
nr:histone-lysine N-methyltransferase setd3 isoform X7 [Ipomoea trifida]